MHLLHAYWLWRSLHGFPLVLKSDRNKYVSCSFKMGTERKVTIELCSLKLTPLMHRLLEMDNSWIKSWQHDPREVTKVSTSHGRLGFGTLLQTPQRTPIPGLDHRQERGRSWPCLCHAPTAKKLCVYTVVSTRKGADLSGWQVPATISMSTLPEQPWHPSLCYTGSLVARKVMAW